MRGGRPSLSVCCLTVDPPRQVARILAFLRPIADEVIVAVDARVDPAELEPYRAVADHLVRYEFEQQQDRARPWLYAQCQSDWLFAIDGDEVPSPALIDALPDLIRRTDVMQYAFPRRWLFPEPAQWLEELPWWPDFQIRLLRNGPTVRHTGQVHDSVDLTYPMAHVDLPIYHLALLTSDVEERRVRSARYEALSPGRSAYGGGRLNEVMYLPESSATRTPQAVPRADLAQIELVLEERIRPATLVVPAETIPFVTSDEIARQYSGPDLATSDYRCRLSAYAESGRMVPGEVRPVYVVVENRGGVAWHWGLERQPLVGVGYHWVDADGATLPDDRRRSPLPETVRPGEPIIVPTFVEAPQRPGRYLLQVDLVHEDVRWFGSPLGIEMQVETLAARPAVRAPTSMLITTIVARNYLPRARVLARSFLEHHPDGQVVVLVIDADDNDEVSSAEPFDVVRPQDLPIDRDEFHRMATIYDVMELATAVKPFLLRYLLFDRRAPAVTYLDPDIEVFAPLDDLDRLARQFGIVLTPHRLDAIPNDGRQPDGRSLMSSGAFNLGYIGVGHGAEDFLLRWSDHCRRNCIIAHDEGFFVDQRWVDVGVVSHHHHVVVDPGCNVAYWNLDTRSIDLGPDGYRVNGWPLRFFHFSGFDPKVPHLLSRHQGDRPAELRDLVRRYASRVEEETRASDTTGEYRWARTAGGIRIDHMIRRLFRDEVLRRELDRSGRSGSVDELPDVFVDDSDDGLVDLLTAPLPGSPVPRVPRLLHHIYLGRPDLQHAFPNLRADGLAAFFRWAATSGRIEHEIPQRVLPTIESDGAHPYWRPPPRTGVNIIGYFTAELGLGEAGRAMLATLEQLDEPFAAINETGTSNRQQHEAPNQFVDPHDYDINLMCVNSDQVPRVMERLGSRIRRDPSRYTVGIWAWELEEFPVAMLAGVPYVDEIWTYSRHSVRSIERAVATPVRHVPPPVLAFPPRSTLLAPNPLGIDAAFTFLFCFDVHSIPERKNPIGVVRAFRQAFAPGAGPTLIVKSINGASSLNAQELLHAEAGDRADIHIVDGYLDRARTHALIADCDCYVSLHRAEGFGYTMAEAMLAGKPVIATGYSGNLDFMNDDNSFLVRSTPSMVPSGCGPYPAGAVWAEPDIDHAAHLMRLVYDRRDLRERVGRRAQHDIATQYSPEALAPLVAARLAEIRARSSSVARNGRPSVGEAAAGATWRATRRAARLFARS